MGTHPGTFSGRAYCASPPRDFRRAVTHENERDEFSNSKILGLIGKPEGMDGSRVEEMVLTGQIEVEEMVLTGQIEEVARYCESDVLNTCRVWHVYELFRGSISAKELDWSEMQTQNFIATRKADNPHLCAAVGIEPSFHPDIDEARRCRQVGDCLQVPNDD
jgi:hypothetical protein